MAYLNFKSVNELKTMSSTEREQYIRWLAGNGVGYDPSGHGLALVGLANSGDWGELAYQLPIMQSEMMKNINQAEEYAQRVKEYQAAGITPPQGWADTAQQKLDYLTKAYSLAPGTAKGETPPTYDQLLEKVEAVNPYSKEGVVGSKEYAAMAGSNPGTPVEGTPTANVGDSFGGGVSGDGDGSGGATEVSQVSQSNVDMTGWTDSMRQSYEAMQDYMKKLGAQGKVLNPDVKLDDTVVARFMEQAKTEVEPFYRQVFDQANKDLTYALEDVKSSTESRVRDIGSAFGRDLEQTQESFANRGLDFSTARDKAEASLAENAKASIEEAAKAAENRAHSLGTQTERTLGSGGMTTDIPKIGAGWNPILGKAGVYGISGPTSSRTLFSPQGGVTGTQERQKLFDTESRKNELIGNERELRGLTTL